MLSEVEINRVKTQLAKFDCNEREVEIYLESLKIGLSTIQDLAKSLKMNRVTVHSAIEQLIEKGLLFESRKKKKRMVMADDPSVLKRMLQQKHNELNLIEGNLDYTIDLLSKINRVDASRPTVKFYEGVSGFKQMLEETLEAKTEFLVYNTGRFIAEAVEIGYLDDYMRRRGEKKINSRLLFPSLDYAKIWARKPKDYRVRVRVAKEDPKWIGGYFAWDEKVALLSFSEGLQTCTILENKDLAYFFRNVVFEMAWKLAEDVN